MDPSFAEKPFELKNIIEALQKVTEWYLLGVHLGIGTDVLKRIEADYTGSERRKSEMLDHWLKGLDRTWEDVNCAVKKVLRLSSSNERRAQEVKRQEIEQRQLVVGIDQVVKSVKEVNLLNEKYTAEKRDLEEKLSEKNEEWEDLQKVWKKEDELAEEQERSTRLKKEAIRNHSFTSQFVKSFLRAKGITENLSKEAIEVCLRDDVILAEMRRSKELLSRCERMNIFRAEVKHIKKDSQRWIECFEKSLDKLNNEIMRGFERILDPIKLKDIKQELEKLKRVLVECQSALQKCKTVHQETKISLTQYKVQLQNIISHGSFSKKELCTSSRKVSDYRLLGGVTGVVVGGSVGGASALEGASVGATAGASVGPLGVIVGGVMGVVIGGMIGTLVGTAIERPDQHLKDVTRKIFDDYQQTEREAKQLREHLSEIFK